MLMKRLTSRIAAEVLIVVALSFASAYVYSLILGGLPQEFLEAMLGLGRVNGVFQAWTSEALGEPNGMLPMAVMGLPLKTLTSAGLSVKDAGLAILALLWSLGGCSVYLLAKRITGSTLSGLTGLAAYLISTLALRGLWTDLPAVLIYTLTPAAILIADRGFRGGSLYHGFLTALVVSLLSGGLRTLGGLAGFTFTLIAYLSALTIDRREKGKLGWIGGFTALTLASWATMNIWWIATPPGLAVDFNSLALTALPIGLISFLVAFKLRGAATLQASILVLAAVILLADPRGAVTASFPCEALATISLGASLLLASALKRLADGLGEYVSLSIVVEEDKGEREYEILKPLICLLTAGLLVYHSLSVGFTWQHALEVPSWYKELGEKLPEGDYRMLALPILCADAHYEWGVIRYPENAAHLTSGKPVIHGCEFASLNNLSTRRGFWKILSALGVRFLVIQMDLDHVKSGCVNPSVLKDSIESNRLDYEVLLVPNIKNGSIDLSAPRVKSLTEPFGFVQLVNYSPFKPHRVEARLVKTEEAQSRIRIYALGVSWISGYQAFLNQTFSFAYILPRTLNCSEYGYLEFWIRVNGSRELTVQLYDIRERWSLWKTEIGDGWSLVTIPLRKPNLDGGLDTSTVFRLVFSLRAPLNSSVEAEVGGIFLDPGRRIKVSREPEPLRISMKHEKLLMYELLENRLTPRIYSVERLLKQPTGNIFESLMSKEFNPRTSAYVEEELEGLQKVKVSYVKESLTSYKVTVEEASERFLIVLSERFHKGWRLYTDGPTFMDILLDAKPANVRHVKVNGFLNGWLVETKGSEELRLMITYRPQKLMETLGILSIAFAVIGLAIKPLREKFKTSF